MARHDEVVRHNKFLVTVAPARQLIRNVNRELCSFLFAGQLPSKVLMSGTVCLWSEGFPSFVPPCGVRCSERIFNALIYLTLCMRVEVCRCIV